MTELFAAISLGALAAGLYLGAVWWRARVCVGRPLLVVLTYPASLACALAPLAASSWYFPRLLPLSAVTLLAMRSFGLSRVAR